MVNCEWRVVNGEWNEELRMVNYCAYSKQTNIPDSYFLSVWVENFKNVKIKIKSSGFSRSFLILKVLIKLLS